MSVSRNLAWRLPGLVLVLGLSACVTPVAAPSAPPPPAPAATAAPALPADARPNLDPHWINTNGQYAWPPADGFAAAPAPVVLPPGMLIDRFGGDGGHFFSPKGAAFSARAVPYFCEKQPYNVYKIMAPLLAWTGKAAPWFDEPGGATQFETDAPVYLLLADHVIEPVAKPGKAPCDGR